MKELKLEDVMNVSGGDLTCPDGEAVTVDVGPSGPAESCDIFTVEEEPDGRP